MSHYSDDYSPYGREDPNFAEKPCRSCVDLKTWRAMMRNGKQGKPVVVADQAAADHRKHAPAADASLMESFMSSMLPKTKRQDWQPKSARDSQQINEEAQAFDEDGHRKDCPLFVDELGRSSWNFLHTMAAKYPDEPNEQQKKDASEFMRLFSMFYPCDFCARDLRKDLKTTPPDVSSQKNFARWMCGLHNLVNKKLGKTQFDCELVQQRWKDGWKDGSCD